MGRSDFVLVINFAARRGFAVKARPVPGGDAGLADAALDGGSVPRTLVGGTAQPRQTPETQSRSRHCSDVLAMSGDCKISSCL